MRTEADGTVTYFPLDHPGSEVAVAWYVELDPVKGNIMAMVFRDGPDKPWKFVIRTRFYRDDIMTRESKDKREGWMIEAKNGEDRKAEFIEKGDKIFMDVLSKGGSKLARIDEHKSLEEFFEIWKNQSWAHWHVEDKIA